MIGFSHYKLIQLKKYDLWQHDNICFSIKKKSVCQLHTTVKKYFHRFFGCYCYPQVVKELISLPLSNLIAAV
uniref:Uncharacterized protein n=1 Tax=Arundo donax TaxID=35708 RepID=A0A0A9D028_ARUDO